MDNALRYLQFLSSDTRSTKSVALSLAGLSGAGEGWRGRRISLSVAAGIMVNCDTRQRSSSKTRQQVEGWVCAANDEPNPEKAPEAYGPRQAGEDR